MDFHFMVLQVVAKWPWLAILNWVFLWSSTSDFVVVFVSPTKHVYFYKHESIFHFLFSLVLRRCCKDRVLFRNQMPIAVDRQLPSHVDILLLVLQPRVYVSGTLDCTCWIKWLYSIPTAHGLFFHSLFVEDTLVLLFHWQRILLWLQYCLRTTLFS